MKTMLYVVNHYYKVGAVDLWDQLLAALRPAIIAGFTHHPYGKQANSRSQ